jgi:phage/plasmid primase-like uncharacterized protein
MRSAPIASRRRSISSRTANDERATDADRAARREEADVSGSRYVSTTAARQAVEGHESEILTALGIDWRSGRTHRECPYPSHADGHPSWRWSETESRAFCTCTKGDDIFDVIEKVEGLSYEEAKVRAVELRGRHDLIQTKTSGQRHDTRALLNAPAENRDDELPFRYLAARLGVNPSDVPRPSTPVGGIKALEYFDAPPSGSRARPKLVGLWPCAVFGTVAADGRKHAHRIYLDYSGDRKADLGNDRDPKKSAKIVDNISVSGCAVVWGDAAAARASILVEGIETASAIALAFRSEIEGGMIAVAAAISAVGLEAFQPWAANREVIVAADRDEGSKPDGRAGSRRGEQAARQFGLRNRERVNVWISLPGQPGESVDWLDILRRDGIEAVRAGILAPAPFAPTQIELDDQARGRGREAELRDVAATYPLPALNSTRLTYMHTTAGEVWVHRFAGMNPDGTPEWEPVTTPFGVSAWLRHIDQADSYGLRVVVADMHGNPRTIDFDRAQLARMGAAEIRAMFMANGLRVEKDGENVVVTALKAANPEREIVVVSRSGWHEIGGLSDPVFVAPSGEVIGAPEGIDLELDSNVRLAPTVAKSGSMEGWRQAIDVALAAENCPHWTLAVCADFVGPVVDITDLDTCGLDLSGFTSQGKTTGQRLAVSGWSAPDSRKRGSLLQSMLATENSMEVMAQRASGTVLVLDELAHAQGQAIARCIYSIAGGSGKGRLDVKAEMRDRRSWKTFALLSSEHGLREKIRSDGGDWTPGMAVRIVDINVDGVNTSVPQSDLDAIGQIAQHYGHAGPAFVSAFIKRGLHREGAALRNRVMQAAKMIAEKQDGAATRAAIPFALLAIAGKLAISFGLIPQISVDDAVTWAWRRFQESPDATALDPETKAIEAIRAWIAERWNVTIKNVDAHSGINNREAVGWYDENAIYIPQHRLREAAGKSLEETKIASALKRKGMLQKWESDRLPYVRYVQKIGKVKAYALSFSEFGRDIKHEKQEIRNYYSGAPQ